MRLPARIGSSGISSGSTAAQSQAPEPAQAHQLVQRQLQQALASARGPLLSPSQRVAAYMVEDWSWQPQPQWRAATSGTTLGRTAEVAQQCQWQSTNAHHKLPFPTVVAAS